MYSFESTDVPVFFKILVKLGVLNSYEEPWMIWGTSQMSSGLHILSLRRRWQRGDGYTVEVERKWTGNTENLCMDLHSKKRKARRAFFIFLCLKFHIHMQTSKGSLWKQAGNVFSIAIKEGN